MSKSAMCRPTMTNASQADSELRRSAKCIIDSRHVHQSKKRVRSVCLSSSATLVCTVCLSTTMAVPGSRSAASYEYSSHSFSTMVCKRRAPMFSTLRFTSAATGIQQHSTAQHKAADNSAVREERAASVFVVARASGRWQSDRLAVGQSERVAAADLSRSLEWRHQ